MQSRSRLSTALYDSCVTDITAHRPALWFLFPARSSSSSDNGDGAGSLNGGQNETLDDVPSHLFCPCPVRRERDDSASSRSSSGAATRDPDERDRIRSGREGRRQFRRVVAQ